MLTTTALYRSSSEWFEARSWKPTPKGLPSSLMQLDTIGQFISNLLLVCACGALSIAQRAQFAAQNLFGDRDAILIEHPLREIDQPPAYDPMDRRDRTGLDHCDERAPLLVIEFRGMPGRLAVDEAIRPPEIEPEDPIANGL